MSAEPPAALEQLEQLEQLRALAMGAWIQVGRRGEAHPPGVDTPEDLDRVDALLSGRTRV
jgi:3-deoxy-manno-octulosonate cytidylyltransferase (CMP-KDO synthetase)